MSEQIKNYLRELGGHLSYLNEMERRDIMEEVSSHIYEKVAAGSSVEEVLAAFGQPKELAQSYGGEVIAKNAAFNFKSLITMIKFYFITGMKGMFIIPIVAITSITFYASAIIIIIATIVKGVASLLGIELPIAILDFGFWQAPYWLALIVSFLVAGLLYVTSRKLWQYLQRFLRNISLKY
ncbi:DUF1700 domain-containing protein [Vagococcus sp. BWB3-3]|uniref:DUF1700 domain-containing protein n=1 Tax=Vagococcus allomyrinae TaxID=2794353 RepID=A0A940P5A9_9ENTE|nr:DUF1700 domain-containing protein [Vagococcus allomyrinae]MBP1041839.1 DUF1700 domain-containing protein [Vagococcus allomyrinae]